MQKLMEHLFNKFNVTFNNTDLLKEAFTHSSYVNEHRTENLKDNERLEFLGDAVLEITVSNYLFHAYPDFPEGVLTRLRAEIVREHSLSEFSKICEFDRYIRLGKGEEQNDGRKRSSLLADLFEAFLGSLFLDQGIDSVNRFLEKVVYPQITNGVFSHGMDYKTTLQEFLQKGGEITIQYDLIEEIGPAHDRQFVAQVRAEDHVLGEGIGRTKKTS